MFRKVGELLSHETHFDGYKPSGYFVVVEGQNGLQLILGFFMAAVEMFKEMLWCLWK